MRFHPDICEETAHAMKDYKKMGLMKNSSNEITPLADRPLLTGITLKACLLAFMHAGWSRPGRNAEGSR